MLKILNINFQSLKTKQGEIRNLISNVNPDIIFGTKTWIDSSVKDAQILPGGFNIYRNDRNLNGGGALLAVKDTLLTSAVPELQTNCEIVWCKLEIVGHKSVYLSTYCNPMTSQRKTSYFDQTCNEFISDWVVMACLGPKLIKVLFKDISSRMTKRMLSPNTPAAKWLFSNKTEMMIPSGTNSSSTNRGVDQVITIKLRWWYPRGLIVLQPTEVSTKW